MDNFESIEDYLTNRLGEQEKKQFEDQLASDPSLRADMVLQKQIIEGVKTARITELKAMLSQVPVPPADGGLSGAVVGKIAATVITAGVIGTSLYFYFGQEEPKKSIPAAPIVSEQPLTDQKTEEPAPTAAATP